MYLVITWEARVAAKQYKALEWTSVDLRQAVQLTDMLKRAISCDTASLCYDSDIQLLSFNVASDNLSTLDTLVTDLCVKAGLPKPSTKVDSLPGIRLMAAADVRDKTPAITDKQLETKTPINKGLVATAVDAVVDFFSGLFS